jgi:predicted PurR-regulated permease PerM
MYLLVWSGLLVSTLMLFHNLATLLGISILFTYLLLPLVDALENWLKRLLPMQPSRRLRLPRALLGASLPQLTPRLMAVIVIYTFSGLLVALGVTMVLPIVFSQSDDLYRAIPNYALQLRQMLVNIAPSLPRLPFTVESWPQWMQHQTSQWILSGAGPLALTRASEWSAHGLRGLFTC